MKPVEAVESILRAKPEREQVLSLEALRQPILSLRTQYWIDLVESKEKLRVPNYKPDKNEPRLTDFDRTTMLEAGVGQLQAQYDYIVGLELLVKERIEVLRWL